MTVLKNKEWLNYYKNLFLLMTTGFLFSMACIEHINVFFISFTIILIYGLLGRPQE